ncbi:MAG TPA: adenylyl-sulfate kinase [Herpetosiphonaceae bacterium]
MAGDQQLPERLTPPADRRGFTIWLTGLPASGKTSLARELQRLLAQRGVHAVLLDSDELRGALTPQPRYTAAERDWFYGVIGYLAAWLARSGVNVLIAATAQRRAYRDQARAQIARFAEVEVCCPLAICQQRDPKGIYAQAQAGQAQHVPGVGDPYEPPLHPEATIDTGSMSPTAAARSVLAQMWALIEGDT